MSQLFEKKCIPCSGKIPPLKGKELQNLFQQLGNHWKIIHEHHLTKDFSFKDFKTALDFTNKIGQLAEKEEHHPDIFLSWGQVTIKIWTHKIDGLTESDFIFASKSDTLY